MVVKYEGKIVYADEKEFKFEIDENNKIKVNISDELAAEPLDHLRLIQNAILRVKVLLETGSPVKFEMEEIID